MKAVNKSGLIYPLEATTTRKFYKTATSTMTTLPSFPTAESAGNGMDGVSINPTQIWNVTGRTYTAGYIPNSSSYFVCVTFEKLFHPREDRKCDNKGPIGHCHTV